MSCITAAALVHELIDMTLSYDIILPLLLCSVIAYYTAKSLQGASLYSEALKRKVIVVPGEFFDVNPGKRRHGRASRFRDYVRFSFGPSLEVVERAMTRLEELVAKIRMIGGETELLIAVILAVIFFFQGISSIRKASVRTRAMAR